MINMKGERGSIPGFISAKYLDAETISKIDPNLISIWGLVQNWLVDGKQAWRWLYVDYGNIAASLKIVLENCESDEELIRYDPPFMFTVLDPTLLSSTISIQLEQIRRKVEPSCIKLKFLK
jgi:hypothetical protein